MNYDKFPAPPDAPPLWRWLPLLLAIVAGAFAADERVQLSLTREQEAAALSSRDPVAALRRLREAWELQRAVDRDPDSANRNLARELRLEHEVARLAASLGGHELAAQIDQLLTKAAGAAKGEAALPLYREAAMLQRRINTEHPRSRFASMERLEEMETLRQNAEAAPVLRAVAALETEVAAHLRRREIHQALAKANEALGRMARLEADCPKVKPDGHARLKLTFLQLRGPELMALQDEAFDALCPSPQNPEQAVSRARVTRRWFAHVMNVSAGDGADLPAETLTMADADEFCRRLGWIMGANVRRLEGDGPPVRSREPSGFRVVAELNLLGPAP